MDTKTFKSVDELISILSDKGLCFKQPKRARRLLQENNYYTITAFKGLFYKKESHHYKEGVDFEHLYSVYIFDKELKTTLLKHILFIETKIKSAINQEISPRYGYKDKDYLKKDNFNLDLSEKQIDETLKKIKEQKTRFGEKNICVTHYKETYGYIPFWILSKCLTMGVIRDLFNILKPSDQDKIVKNMFDNKDIKKPVIKAKTMIAFLADIRNMCAHDEVLVGYRHSRLFLPHLPEHDKLECKMRGTSYLHGANDILALLIIIKYFVNKTIYNEFIQEIAHLVNKYYKQISNVVSKKDFLEYIGLIENYEKIK